MRQVNARSTDFHSEATRSAVTDYAHNLFVNTDLRDLSHYTLVSFCREGLIFDLVEQAKLPGTELDEAASTASLREALQGYLRKCKGKARAPRPLNGSIASNLATLSTLLDLDDNERAVLRFIVAMNLSGELSTLTGKFGELGTAECAQLTAAALNVRETLVMAALHPRGRLRTSGIVNVPQHVGYLTEKVELKSGVIDELMVPDLTQERLLTRFLPVAGSSALRWSDVDYMTAKAHLARDLLRGALGTKRKGINLLFHGATGTGKTALAKLLAADVGAKLYVAGLADEDGESAPPRERLSSLLLGQRLATNGPALLVFDEIEDLFKETDTSRHRGRPSASMSKQWFNDFLENNPVPVIWITNSLRGIDPAFLRRFAFALEFRPLTRAQRARALSRHLGKGSTLTPSDITAIVERHEAGPAQLETAVNAARLISGNATVDRTTLERILTPIEKAMSGKSPSSRRVFDPTTYRIDALNSSTDLSALADTISREAPRDGLSFCVYGPPGTGKTEYVKYLAHRMGLPVMHKRASDLLGMYIGESEKRIAEAFARAEEEQAVLLFDEVDSFLRDRTTAVRSWEVSQVNELLQQMESFRGVFACTTNLWHDIDQAALRRFVFKIEMKFLRTNQAMLLFESLFDNGALTRADLDDVRHALSSVNNLTPGDFALIRRRQRALNTTSSPRELIDELLAEARAKKGSTRAIGFDRGISATTARASQSAMENRACDAESQPGVSTLRRAIVP